MNIIPFYTSRRRHEITARMADCLQGTGLHDERDARSWLRAHNFDMLDIVICLPDAMALSVQEAVAREMSAP